MKSIALLAAFTLFALAIPVQAHGTAASFSFSTSSGYAAAPLLAPAACPTTGVPFQAPVMSYGVGAAFAPVYAPSYGVGSAAFGIGLHRGFGLGVSRTFIHRGPLGGTHIHHHIR